MSGKLHCSMCLLSQDEVAHLVAGLAGFVCSECAAVVVSLAIEQAAPVKQADAPAVTVDSRHDETSFTFLADGKRRVLKKASSPQQERD